MVELEIDDQAVVVEEGATIIEAADKVGIYIPRFCYHNKLSIAANCRMCLVEVEGSRKPLPACATPVTEQMKVYTASKIALEAQRSVMEFLLINHPLDCPICDQGGMCELQDLAMGFGGCHSVFDETKVATHSPDIGPLIDTEMTRCIKCTRCVRFGEEIAGLRELGVVNRGENAEITTYVKHIVKSELSGNIIDICPVGALNAKPSRYAGRGWEVNEHPSVAPHDCVGSNVFIHCRRHDNHEAREILSVVPRHNDQINEAWISDRDRFSYEALQHEDRVLQPMIKRKGQWMTVSWQRALVEIADKIRAIVGQHGGSQLAAIASPNSTTEESYLLQKLLRGLESNHIDHRIHQQDFADQDFMLPYPGMETSIADIDAMEAILLVGSNVRTEQPILSHRMNQAVQMGAAAMAVNPIDYPFIFPLEQSMIEADVLAALAQIAKAVAGKAGDSHAVLKGVEPSVTAKAIASQLKKAGSAGIFLGEYALGHPHAAIIRSLVRLIATYSKSHVAYLTAGANSAGAYLAGAVPHYGAAGNKVRKVGLDAKQLFTTDPVKAYLLLGTEPELDSAYPAAAMQALSAASLVVCMTAFSSQAMRDYADFILPIAPFGENAGTFVNAEGSWQTFYAATVPQGEAKPAWKVLRALAGFLMLDDFDYQTEHQVIDELREKVNKMAECEAGTVEMTVLPVVPPKELTRIAPWPIYRGDSLVRRAAALQAVHEGELCIEINAATAKQLRLVVGDMTSAKQGDSAVRLPLRVNDRLSDGVVVIPSGCDSTQGFGQFAAPVVLVQGAL